MLIAVLQENRHVTGLTNVLPKAVKELEEIDQLSPVGLTVLASCSGRHSYLEDLKAIGAQNEFNLFGYTIPNLKEHVAAFQFLRSYANGHSFEFFQPTVNFPKHISIPPEEQFVAQAEKIINNEGLVEQNELESLRTLGERCPSVNDTCSVVGAILNVCTALCYIRSEKPAHHTKASLLTSMKHFNALEAAAGEIDLITTHVIPWKPITLVLLISLYSEIDTEMAEKLKIMLADMLKRCCPEHRKLIEGIGKALEKDPLHK